MGRIGRIVKILLFISIMAVILTGCTVAQLHDYVDNFSGALAEEGQYNKDCVDALIKAGIMDKQTGETIKQGIIATEKKYTNLKTELDDTFLESISWVIPRSIADKTNAGSWVVPDSIAGANSELSFEEVINAEYRAHLADPENITKPSKKEKSKISKLLNVEKITESTNDEGEKILKVKYKKELVKAANPVKPINFIALSDDNEAMFNSKSTVPVYILRSAAYLTDEAGSKEYHNKEWYHNQYGGKPMDELLNAIKELREGEGTDEKIRTNKAILAKYFSNSGTTLADELNFKTTRSVKLTSNGIHSLNMDVISFNKSEIEKIYGRLDKTEGKYFIYDGIAYLLEYPVHYIQTIVADKDGGNNWELQTDETDMVVNFLSGELLDKSGNKLSQADGTDNIYHINQVSGTSSFMLGSNLVTYENIGNTKKTIGSCIQIVLRDYIELVYVPDAIPYENFVALGRRIRIDNVKGSLGTPLGHFIDKKGNKVWDKSILATDVISAVVSGAKNKDFDYTGAKVKVNLKYGAGGGDLESSVGDDGMINKSGIFLRTVYTDHMRIAFEFPWEGKAGLPNIGGSDIGNKDIKGPQLYAIATDVSLFDSGLYQNWINVTGDGGDIGSLEWWNDWLTANGYIYRAIAGSVKDALGQTYSYELAKEGYIVLDIDTVSKIQKQYDREAEVTRVAGVRTAFIVVGILLIVYSLLLPIAWLYDVNIVNGPRLLSKLSFGFWVAIASSDEIPSIGVGRRQYMNFGAVVIKSLIICSIGILLFMLDFVEVAGMVWKLFGNLVESIEELVFNIF